MSKTVTVQSKTDKGGLAELTLLITGSDTAKIILQTWDTDPPAAGAAPSTTQEDAFDVRELAGKSGITCKVSPFLFVTTQVTCTLQGGAGKAPSVSVAIPLLSKKPFNYPLSDADYQKLQAFIADSGFPPAA